MLLNFISMILIITTRATSSNECIGLGVALAILSICLNRSLHHLTRPLLLLGLSLSSFLLEIRPDDRKIRMKMKKTMKMKDEI